MKKNASVLKIRILLWIAAVLAVSGGTSEVSAFDSDLHRKYTAAAFRLYVEHCTPRLPHKAEVLADSIVRGAQFEDDMGPSRIRNWHFYNRYGKVEDRWYAKTTLDRIFEERALRLDEALSSKPRDWPRIYSLAGRVLHYLQDMSVPAHVAPIYHLKVSVLFFDAGNPDLFDGYRLTNKQEKVMAAQQSADLRKETPKRGYAGLRRMLDATAEHTIAAISDPQWRRYWGDPAVAAERNGKLPGFAEYGSCRFVWPGQPSTCDDEKTRDHFYSERYRRVVEDTVRGTALLGVSGDYRRPVSGCLRLTGRRDQAGFKMIPFSAIPEGSSPWNRQLPECGNIRPNTLG